MKKLQWAVTLLVLVTLVMSSFTALAQQAQETAPTGITVNVGDWILQFTEVTDDQEAIEKEQTGSQVLVANPGYKIIRLRMNVPAEAKRTDIEDLSITLVEKDGTEKGFSVRMHRTSADGLISNIECLIIVQEVLTFEEITLHISTKGQDEFTCPLSDVMAGKTEQTAAAMETITVDGMELSIREPGAFEALEEGLVLTRLGDTEIGGMTAWPGSSLMMDTIKQSKQYSLLLVSFAFVGGADAEADADKLGEAAAAIPLEYNGTAYEAKAVWVTDGICCFIYDCAALKGVPLAFEDAAGIHRLVPKP
jgi:hypothetical protein